MVPDLDSHGRTRTAPRGGSSALCGTASSTLMAHTGERAPSGGGSARGPLVGRLLARHSLGSRRLAWARWLHGPCLKAGVLPLVPESAAAADCCASRRRLGPGTGLRRAGIKSEAVAPNHPRSWPVGRQRSATCATRYRFRARAVERLANRLFIVSVAGLSLDHLPVVRSQPQFAAADLNGHGPVHLVADLAALERLTVCGRDLVRHVFTIAGRTLGSQGR